MAEMLQVLVDPAHLLHTGQGAGLLVGFTAEIEDWLYMGTGVGLMENGVQYDEVQVYYRF